MKRIVLIALLGMASLTILRAGEFTVGAWRGCLTEPAGGITLYGPEGRTIEMNAGFALPPWQYAASRRLKNARPLPEQAGQVGFAGEIASAAGNIPFRCLLREEKNCLLLEWRMDFKEKIQFAAKPFLSCVCRNFPPDFTVCGKKMVPGQKNCWGWGSMWQNTAAGIAFSSDKACSMNYLFSGSSHEIRVVAQPDGKSFRQKIRITDPSQVKSFTALRIEGKCERARALFARGETMRFVFHAFDGKKPLKEDGLSWQWKRQGDDGKVQEGTASAAKPLTVETSLDRPGFVWLQVRLLAKDGTPLTNNGKKVIYNAGAGVEITSIRGAEPPTDIAGFRLAQRKKLQAVPVKAELIPAKTVRPGVKLFKVKVACPGPRPVTGFLTIPEQGTSFPAQVNFYGYSKDSIQQPVKKPSLTRIEFWVNAHGYELEQSLEYYRNFYAAVNTDPRGYAWNEKENRSPETAYFNGMSLRAARAAQFLTTLPEWNKQDLCAAGGSQGGLQALWCAWLAPESVTRVSVEKPWCCFLQGPEKGFFSAGLTLKPLPGVLYFDPVNFISQFKIPVNLYYAGLGDYMCPPSGLAALFNRMPAGSEITFYQGGTHGGAPAGAQRFTLKK